MSQAREAGPEGQLTETLPGPALVIGVYRVKPDKRSSWLDTWQHLARMARTRPGCLTFDLDPGPADGDTCLVISTWSIRAGFDRFVREVGLTWIERHLDYSKFPPHYVHLDSYQASEADSSAARPARGQRLEQLASLRA